LYLYLATIGQAGDLAGNGALGDGKPLSDVADSGRLIHKDISKNLSLFSIKHSRYREMG
jgi:hypothetical protein